MRVVVIGGFAPSMVAFRGPLLRALVARGHDVVAMAGDGTPAIARELAALGVQFEPLAIQRAGVDARADLATLVHLTRRLRELRAELVFAYTIKPVIYGMLAARLAGVPRRAAMLTGLGYAFGAARGGRRRAIAGLARGLLRLGLGAADVLFLHNADDHADLMRARVLPRRLRVEVVRGSGVDIDHYARAPLPSGPTVFLFLGRLLADKGIREFVHAARTVRAAYPETRFRVAGWLDPNPESVSAADLASWTGAGIVEYLGSTEDVRDHLAQAHVLVLPSYREGTPRSVLEAMSVGRAVITTDAPGCRDTVVDRESGWIVPVRDGDAVARAALALAVDRGMVERFGGAARARVEQLYDARAVAADMLARMGL